MTLTPAEIAILIRPLFAVVFYVTVTAPIMWVLFRMVPDGDLKVTLFKVRDGAEATRHDRAVKLWAAIAGNAVLWGWIAFLIASGP